MSFRGDPLALALSYPHQIEEYYIEIVIFFALYIVQTLFALYNYLDLDVYLLDLFFGYGGLIMMIII